MHAFFLDTKTECERNIFLTGIVETYKKICTACHLMISNRKVNKCKDVSAKNLAAINNNNKIQETFEHKQILLQA